MPIITPNDQMSRLQSDSFEFQFNSYLSAWGGTNAAAPPEPGANLYAVINEVPWSVVIKDTVTYNLPNIPIPEFHDTGSASTKLASIPFAPGSQQMVNIGGEVCSPWSVKRIQVLDYTH